MLTEGGHKASLMQVIRGNHEEATLRIGRDFVEAGYSIDTLITEEGDRGYLRTALHEAVQMSSPAVVQALLDLGASPDALDSSGQTPLHVAVRWMASQRDRIVIIETLLKHGARAHTVDESNETPLLRAMTSHAQLRERGNSLSGKLREGLASDAEMLQLSRLLIKAGADPDFLVEGAKPRYRSAFQMAVQLGLVDQVQLFVEEYGVDWTQKTLSKKSMRQIAESDEMKGFLLACKIGEKVLEAVVGEGADADIGSLGRRSSLAL